MCYRTLMNLPDLNLLITLDAVLSEGSVAGAARRLGLSPSAMSRALARLREVTGDPLLVRAGRGLTPTPRAVLLREQVGPVLLAAQQLLQPAAALDVAGLTRTFTLRVSDGFVDNFGPALLAHVAAQAPAVRLSFVQKIDRDSQALRSGAVDLETGVIGADSAPELRVQALFRDQFIGVARADHPLTGQLHTLEGYCQGSHVALARQGMPHGPVDVALQALGRQRRIVAQVSGFATALALARASELIASVPARHTGQLRDGMHSFALPFAAPTFTVSLMWHPRMEGDAAHRWLRGCVRAVCAASL